MSQILAAAVRILHHRNVAKIYWPTVLWAVNLFVLLTLVWWSDFSLISHDRWTFAIFLAMLALPGLLYINAALILPGSDRAADEPMRDVYIHNRKPFFALQSLAIVISFLQTYLIDGHVKLDIDAELKLGILAIVLIPLMSKAELIQTIVAVANLAWLLFYVTLLFGNVRS